MAMLAEPRRRQKWTLNPRGKHWSDDSNKFGQKMLEKMGWSSGKGLGANLDGMTEHIRARYKNDQAGIGFSHDDKDKQWTEHQEGYNELLQKLHNGETTEETSSKDKELSGKSLELKSKQSRARVHYQKFTRGKDVNKYSSKDLANIFGKKDLSEKLETPKIKIEPIEEPEETTMAPIGTSDSSHGVVTIKGGSITDYFKTKMSSIGRKIIHDEPNDSGSETERHVGFGFSSVCIKNEPGTSEIEKFSFENPALDISSPSRFVPKKIKTEPETSEIDKFSFENPALDISSPEIVSKATKRKIDYVFENPALDLGTSPSDCERVSKRRKNEFAFVNGGLDLEDPKNLPKIEKIEFKTDSVETSIPEDTLAKKRRKKKSREILPEVAECFTNEALSLECREDENSNSAQFEVTRPNFGLANDALDLSDESNGKKRVTFNETVEYEIDAGSTRGKKKKSKNAAKLDKFEVDNGKLKKKKKKSKKVNIEAPESAFVNDAMDVVILSQEASENAINERKIERERRKRDRRRSNLETIVEAEEEKDETSGIPEVVTLNDSIVCDSDEPQILSYKGKEKRRKKRKVANGDKIDENSIKFDPEIEETAGLPEVVKKPRREARKEENCIETVVIVEEESSGKKKKRKKRDKAEPEVAEETEVKKKNLLKPEVEEETEIEKKHSIEPVVVKDETPEVKKKKKKHFVNMEIEEEETEVEEKHLIEPEVVKKDTPEMMRKKKKNIVKTEIEEESQVEREVSVEPEVAEEFAESPEVKKKKKRLLVQSEVVEEFELKNTIKVENVDKENAESPTENTEIESAKKRKKSKKEKTKITCKTEINIEESSEILTNGILEFHSKSTEVEWEMEAAKNHAEMQNGLRSPWDGKAKISKKIFKELFARSPVVHFAGSNINEIKGYGADFH